VPFAFIHAPIDPGYGKAVDIRQCDPSARVILVADGRILVHLDHVTGTTPLSPLRILEHFNIRHIFRLGRVQSGDILVASLADDTDTSTPQQTGLAQPAWHRIRALIGCSSTPEASFAAQALALAYWHLQHRYCSRCGAPMKDEPQHAHRCTNADCAKLEFPRVDPAVIVAVTDADERLLLGRQANWEPERYSVIAGFVSSGESLEQAVVREIREETGIIAEDPTYIASQPWPFPHSLMLGFSARTVGTDFAPEDNELAEIRWFSRKTYRADRDKGVLLPPASCSISRFLIEHWLHRQG